MGDFEPVFKTHPGWRRLYLDLPGHGSTPVPPSLHNHDDVVDILLEFMDTVAPGEHFVVAGVSWGGYLARGVVHHRLKQVDGVMLYIPSSSWYLPSTNCLDNRSFTKTRILPARFNPARNGWSIWLSRKAVPYLT